MEPGYVPASDSMGTAVASMVLGIISLVLFMLGINVIAAIISIVLGIIVLVRNGNQLGKIFSVIGIVTSIISIIACIVSWAFIMHNAANIEKIYDDTEGMQELYEFYGIGEQDELPFNDQEFDIDDTL